MVTLLLSNTERLGPVVPSLACRIFAQLLLNFHSRLTIYLLYGTVFKLAIGWWNDNLVFEYWCVFLIEQSAGPLRLYRR